jgi:hypothetical protein
VAAARLLVARGRARAGVLAGIAAVAVVLAGLGTIVGGLLLAAPVDAVRAGLAAASGADGSLRWQTRLDDDPDAQSDAAAQLLDRLLLPSGATWERSVQTLPVAATADGRPLQVDGADVGAVLVADPAAPHRAQLVDGIWHDDPGAADAATAAAGPGAVPATVQADAAAATGVAPGSVLELGGIRLVVVGTWEPAAAGDPAWMGDPLVAGGVADGGAGPFLVADDVVAGLEATAFARWTALPDADAATPDSAVALSAALARVEPALRDEAALGGDGIIRSGALDDTLAELAAGIGAMRAVAPLPLLLLGVAGAISLLRLAALLGTERRGETVLLRARGASATALGRDAAVEAFVVAAPAAALGAVGSRAVLDAIDRGAASAAPLLPWTAAAAVALAVVVVLAGAAWHEARRPVVRGGGDETGRARRALAATGIVLLGVTAAVALWQFRLYGSPLVTDAGGGVDVDPLAALAPVLVLLALAVASLGLARPVGAVLERGASARPGLLPSLPVRQLVRRAPLYASVSLVAAFAVGGLTLAAVVDGSWRAFDGAAAAAATGGDVRVELLGRDVVSGEDQFAADDPFAGADGARASVPVFRGEVRIGSDPATLVATALPRLEAVAPEAAARLDPATLAALSAWEAGPAVEPGALLRAEVTVEPAPGAAAAPEPLAGEVSVAFWFLGDGGAATRVPAGSIPVAAGGGTVTATAPELDGTTLLGIEARLSEARGGPDLVIGFDQVAAEPGGPLDAGGEVTVSSTEPTGRIPAAGSDAPVPVVIDAPLAARIDAAPGDPLQFRVQVGGAELDAVVVDVVRVLPSGERAILADLGAVGSAAFAAGAGVPQAGERWIASDDPPATAAALTAAPPVALVATTRADASTVRSMEPAIAALWIGAAGALLFALVTLAALVAALVETRAGEVAVLRALGVPARDQGGARAVELAGLVAAATVVGVAIGLVAGALTGPQLARAVVPGAPAALASGLGVAWLPWATGILVLAVATLLAGVAAATAVRRQAARPGTAEAER